MHSGCSEYSTSSHFNTSLHTQNRMESEHAVWIWGHFVLQGGTLTGPGVEMNAVVSGLMSALSVTSSPGRCLCSWDSSCSARSSRGGGIPTGGAAGLQRSLGGVLQAAGCVLWTDGTGPRAASQPPAGTGWYRGSSGGFLS